MFEDRPIEDAVMKDQSAEDRAAKAAADKAKLQERLERMNRDGYVVDAGCHCDHCVVSLDQASIRIVRADSWISKPPDPVSSTFGVIMARSR